MIENTNFLDSEALQIDLEFKTGHISISGSNFSNIHTSDTNFVKVLGTFRYEGEIMSVSISDCIFTNNTGSFGVKCEESANAQLVTERCIVRDNDM